MDTRNIIKHSDPIRHDDLRSLAKQSGPTVSLVIPTHRGGAEKFTDSQRLRPMMEEAREALAQQYPDVDADALLKPVVTLIKDEAFWLTQCDGLAIFATPEGTRHFRLDRGFTPQVTVGDHPNLRPVLSLVTNDLEFLLLALSQNKVRLFAADRATITPLPLEDIPGSAEEVKGAAVNEPRIQHQTSHGAGPAHGTGPREHNVLSGFLQNVGKNVEKRFTNDKRPMVLAAVDEHQGALRDQFKTVTLLDSIVSGNPDRVSELDLHAAAWPLVKEESIRRHDHLVDRLSEALGTGLATNDPELIMTESMTGRVETLILADRALENHPRSVELDAAISNTLINSGRVDTVPELPGNHAAGAIFRH